MQNPTTMKRNDSTPSKQSIYLIALALFIVTVAVYARCASFGFQYEWDDAFYVVDNQLIRSFSVSNISSIFTRTFQGHYSPLVFISYQFDYLIGGPDATIYHIDNIVLHAVNTVLCFILVRTLSDRTGLALLTALVFSLHPVNVESVAWISQRKTLLSSTFALFSLLAYHRWTVTRCKIPYAAAFVFFLFGLAAKASIVGLPLLLVLMEARQTSDRKNMIIYPAAFLLLAAAFSIGTAIGFKNADVVAKTDSSLLFGTIYPSSLAITFDYLRLVFSPTQLSTFYDIELFTSYLAPKVLGGLVLIVLTTLYIFRRGTPAMRFWFLWSVFFFLPNSNLVPLQTFYADRYLYLPLIGISACFLLTIEQFCRRFLSIAKINKIAIPSTIVILPLLTFLTWQRCGVWQNELTLWADTAAKSSKLYKARLNYGVALEKAGRYEDALKEYTDAVGIFPDPTIVSHIKILRKISEIRSNTIKQ